MYGTSEKESIATGRMLHLSLAEKCTFNRPYCEWGPMKYNKRAEKVPDLLGEKARDTRWMGTTSQLVLCTAVRHCCDLAGMACSPWREQLSAQCFSAASCRHFGKSMAWGLQAKFMFFFFPGGLLWPLCLDKLITVLQSCNLQDINGQQVLLCIWMTRPRASDRPDHHRYLVESQAQAFAIVLKLFMKKYNYWSHSQPFYAITWDEWLRNEDKKYEFVRSMRSGLKIKIIIFLGGVGRCNPILKVLSVTADLSRVPHEQEILFTRHRK